ncbi:hypothetical protein SARC_12995, partial [Sphaeroforma arctica JP610]
MNMIDDDKSYSLHAATSDKVDITHEHLDLLVQVPARYKPHTMIADGDSVYQSETTTIMIFSRYMALRKDKVDFGVFLGREPQTTPDRWKIQNFKHNGREPQTTPDTRKLQQFQHNGSYVSTSNSLTMSCLNGQPAVNDAPAARRQSYMTF